MEFSNNPILIEELPAVGKVDFNPLETNFLKVLRITFLISTLIALFIFAAVIFFVKALQLAYIIYPVIGVFLFLTLFGWISMTLSFKNSGYAFREKDILYKRGWLVRKIKVVPVKRVQHVSVQSGPIERKFGLSSISIFTAGSSEADFTIRGITRETAFQIKEWLSQN